MIVHGSSHGIAVFICTVTASLFADFVRTRLPSLFNFINLIAEWLHELLGFNISVDAINFLLYASILGFIWGMAYKVIRDRAQLSAHISNRTSVIQNITRVLQNNRGIQGRRLICRQDVKKSLEEILEKILIYFHLVLSKIISYIFTSSVPNVLKTYT